MRFFEEGCVSPEVTQRYVQESDISVSCYFDYVETRYSHRTRFVDLIRAELPFIRGAMYVALKNLCQSPPLHDG